MKIEKKQPFHHFLLSTFNSQLMQVMFRLEINFKFALIFTRYEESYTQGPEVSYGRI